MNLADIRKKAKAQKKVKETISPEPDEKLVSEASPIETEIDVAEETLSALETLPSNGELEVGAANEAEQKRALDELFALPEDLALATEEDYLRTLTENSAKETEDVLQCLAFNLGEEEYALDIGQIREIIKHREVTDIPRVPDYLLGIISLRGLVVPVYDLMKRFRLGESTLTNASRIIVCQNEENVAGLLVDCINQVFNLQTKDIEPPPAILSGLDRDLVEGVGRYQGRMMILLNLPNVINVELA